MLQKLAKKSLGLGTTAFLPQHARSSSSDPCVKMECTLFHSPKDLSRAKFEELSSEGFLRRDLLSNEAAHVCPALCYAEGQASLLERKMHQSRTSYLKLKGQLPQLTTAWS